MSWKIVGEAYFARLPRRGWTFRRGGLAWRGFDLKIVRLDLLTFGSIGGTTWTHLDDTMAPVSTKRRRVEDEARRPKKKIRVKRQKNYHSSSEDEDEGSKERIPVQSRPIPKSVLKRRASAPEQIAEDQSSIAGLEGFNEAEKNAALNGAAALEDEGGSEDEDAESEEGLDSNQLMRSGDEEDSNEDLVEDDDTSMTSSQAATARKKRNDPDAFATSLSKILDTKLTTAKRQDPVLSRSKSASDANKSLADGKLEAAAKAQLRAEKKQALEKGRIKDVLALDSPDVDTGKVQEKERRLKKTAQRGVVKLFNAVRAAQVKAEEGMRQARDEGVVGLRQREERVQEMSKEGFLELISRGGTQQQNGMSAVPT